MIKVAIVGRVNVGKSTLFNRLTESMQALVSEIPGTTRDRNYGTCRWRGFEFMLIDTGGVVGELKKGVIEEQIVKQVQIAIEEAKLVLLVVDGREGKTGSDARVAKLLQQARKPTVVAVNKVDSLKVKQETLAEKWQNLGFGDPLLVSAATGSGTGDLLDRVTQVIGATQALTKESVTPFIKVVFVGRPNVGKSSLMNALLKQERMIVSEIPFTTREPNDTLVEFQGYPILLVDTVGLRRKGKVGLGLEKIGALKTLNVLKRADLALLIIDPFKELVGHQDLELARWIIEYQKSVILVVNKCDLAEKSKSKNLKAKIQNAFPHLSFAPILLISAKNEWNVPLVFQALLEVAGERKKIIPQPDLERYLIEASKLHQATIYTKYRQKTKMNITGIKQIHSNPPRFLLTKNVKDPLPKGFVGFFEKRFRKQFGFLGTPIEFIIKTEERKNVRREKQ